jgi:hypothetical protein
LYTGRVIEQFSYSQHRPGIDPEKILDFHSPEDVVAQRDGESAGPEDDEA